MIIFHADLDNTLIYSYKHDIGADKVCVEVYQGRNISFMTKKSVELLKVIHDKILVVPTTTRTIEQYRRIDMGITTPHYALVCNGGVLLVDGEEDLEWFEASERLVASSVPELKKAEQLLLLDGNINFEIRNIKGLFLFTKSKAPEQTIAGLKKVLDLSLVDVFVNGAKVYVVPITLSKGIAIQRFREKMKPDYVIAAGDSDFDVPMLNEADISLAPMELREQITNENEGLFCERRQQLFSEAVLHFVHNKIARV